MHGSRLLVLAVGLGLLGACATKRDFTEETAAPEDAAAATEEVFRRGSESLVRIETPHRVAGGFIVGEDGVIVTGYALVQHEVTARVVLPDGTMFAIDRVLAVSPERDLVLVSIAAQGLPVLELSQHPIAAGDRVIAVGHAIGMAGPSVAEGVLGTVPKSDALRIATPLPAGFFGAPVLDDTGRAVGMIGAQRADGAALLTAASIAGVVSRMKRDGSDETMRAFGLRTREAEGWEGTAPLDVHVLDDCSMQSRERLWGEIETAIASAAPVFDLGGTEAAQRVLEGAVLYLSREIDDCKKLIGVLATAAEQSRSEADPMQGASLLAEALHAALEVLFETSHALSPTATNVPPSSLRNGA
jgi:hypothetical protein